VPPLRFGVEERPTIIKNIINIEKMDKGGVTPPPPVIEDGVWTPLVSIAVLVLLTLCIIKRGEDKGVS